jgi:hypothetical protein
MLEELFLAKSKVVLLAKLGLKSLFAIVVSLLG